MALPGGPADVEKLVDEYYGPLYRYAFRLSGSAADAEDLTQEAFYKAQRSIRQLRESDRAKAWLFSILRNAYLHGARAQRRRVFVSLDEAGDVPETLPDPLPGVDPERLQQALDDLPEAFRTPVILFYFEDFTYREIADQMDLPLGTVMSRLARARAHLRTHLLRPAALAGEPRRDPDGL